MKLGADLQAFDGDDIGAVQFAGKNQAGIYRLAVHHHRAGAAIAGAAAFLGAGDADLVAQQVEQESMGLDLAADGFAVEGELNFRVHGNSKFNWSDGVLEYWSVGLGIGKPITPSLHYSITPFF